MQRKGSCSRLDVYVDIAIVIKFLFQSGMQHQITTLTWTDT